MKSPKGSMGRLPGAGCAPTHAPAWAVRRGHCTSLPSSQQLPSRSRRPGWGDASLLRRLQVVFHVSSLEGAFADGSPPTLATV